MTSLGEPVLSLEPSPLDCVAVVASVLPPPPPPFVASVFVVASVTAAFGVVPIDAVVAGFVVVGVVVGGAGGAVPSQAHSNRFVDDTASHALVVAAHDASRYVHH